MSDTTIGFELKLVDRARMTDPIAEKRKADKENGRLQAQQFAQEALLTAVGVMRTTKDETQKLKACKMIMERAWGIPKSAVEEEDNNRSHSILEVLAAISSTLQLPAAERVGAVTVEDKGLIISELDSILVQE